MPGLFDPLNLGALALAHRIVMAPMGGLRAAEPGGVPTLSMAEHYARRASTGGLIIAEASPVSWRGTGQSHTPGIYSAEQVNNWRLVTDAIHAHGGLVMAQLWHAGRLAQPTPDDGESPIGASGIRASGIVYAPARSESPARPPQSISEGGIEAVIDEFRCAAENAADAGFDGVELHCANGCLVDQFLQDRTNDRRDRLGGTRQNRIGFLRDLVESLASVWGPGRVGVRLSPFGKLNDIGDTDPLPLFTSVLSCMHDLGAAYVHLMEPRAGGGHVDPPDEQAPRVVPMLRPHFPGVLIASGGFDARSAALAIEHGEADAIAFGRYFLSNPDLPQRLRSGAALQPFEPADYFALPDR